MKNSIAKWTVLWFLVTSLLGCHRLGLGIRPAESGQVPPNAPVLLTEAALPLAGASLEALVHQKAAAQTPQNMDSQWLRRVAAEVSPAVVSIYTRTLVPYRIKLLPLPGSGLHFDVNGEALGSGFFISASGYLLTNSHVIENATAIVARTLDEVDHELIVVAKDRVFDLALLKVKAPDREYPALPMGRSEDVRIGDWVLAVGNPLGLGHTVTHGIVSQTGRQIVPIDNSKESRAIQYLQTDTAINPGSSGGPLVTLDGAWIAVNTAVLVGTQGISFCVPAKQVEEFLLSVLAGKGELVRSPSP
ncbi:MAG: trypsin-like peptidase domain-containing protein [Myxococcota bacterium]|nr:trypsin-like peptidase domain-containing protein [Myxococcota bacterium]